MNDLKIIKTYISKTEYKLDIDCPTNISLTDLGKIIKPVTIKYPKEISHFVLLNQRYVRYCAYNILQVKDMEEFETWTKFLAIIFVIQLFKKDIKYCDKNVLQLAIARAKHNHLFKNGISNAIDKLSKAITLRFYNKLTINNIHKYIYELRHRISQSVKAIARIYMKIKSEPENVKKDCNVIAENILNNILMFGLNVDGKSYDLSIVPTNDLHQLLKLLCESKAKEARELVAKLFKLLKVSDHNEQVRILRSLKEKLR